MKKSMFKVRNLWKTTDLFLLISKYDKIQHI